MASTARLTTCAAFGGFAMGVRDRDLHLRGAVGAFLDHAGDLVHRRGGLLDAGGLLFVAQRQIVRGSADF
jgi:hypothetical protein